MLMIPVEPCEIQMALIGDNPTVKWRHSLAVLQH